MKQIRIWLRSFLLFLIKLLTEKRWFLAAAGYDDNPNYNNVTELFLQIEPDAELIKFYNGRLFTAEEGDERLANIKKD